MEAPASGPRPRILGRSSMFCFFRSLVGSKRSPKSSDKAPQKGLRGQDAVPLMTNRHRWGRAAWRETRPPTRLTCARPGALPRPSPSGLEMGAPGPQTSPAAKVLRVVAQSVEVKPVLPRGSQEVLGHLSELEEREEAATGEASGNTGTSERGHSAQALVVELGCVPRAVGPLEFSPEASREEECLLDGDLRLASSKVGAAPWNRLLGLYKRLQKGAMAKFPLKEGLPGEEPGEEEEAEEEEDSALKLCVPGTVTLQSPLHKAFRSTDTVGFVEAELKKLLVVQRESRLWKMVGYDGRELLTQPEITLEEAGVVDGQHLLLEEMDEMGNWPPE
ncbi:gametogenetin-binding protein 1-like isoform 1-T1 [Dama dama]|uniref:gametogenetin-binding protein 1-like n=1 Tax=Dama dama TaxID=30532 RepID=UPI002A3700E2|nr:gametogenetin-binding protein 1-like [Dama dama]